MSPVSFWKNIRGRLRECPKVGGKPETEEAERSMKEHEGAKER